MDILCIHIQQYQHHYAQISNSIYIYIYPKLLATPTTIVSFQQFTYILPTWYLAILNKSNNGASKHNMTQHVGHSNPMSWHCFTWRPIHVDLVCHATQSLATQYPGVTFIQYISYMTQYVSIVFSNLIS